MTAPVTVAEVRDGRTVTRAGQPPLLFAGVCVASLGGPLALVALYVPSVLADASGHAVAVSAAGVVAFAAPTLIWWRYSARVAGPGGLMAFTSAAAGRRVGQIQALLWLTSYALYLLYTTDYVVYDILPAFAPSTLPWRTGLELVLPLVVVGVVVAPLRVSFTVLALSAVGQFVLAIALVVIAAGAHSSAAVGVAAVGSATSMGSASRAAGNIALLFICASLPVFFGGDVAGRGRTVARSIGGSVAAVGALVVVAALPSASMSRFASAEIPGVAIARAAGFGGFGLALGVGVAVSVMSLVVIEYLAVARLAHALTGRPVRTVTRWLAVPLVAANAVALAAPGRFYDDLLRPSLVALWLAQLVPVVAYPTFAARLGRLRASDLAASGAATALFVFGLYTALGGAAS